MCRSHSVSINLEGQDRNIFKQMFPHFGLPRVSSSVTNIENKENKNIFTVTISANDISHFKTMESLKLLDIEQIGTSQEYKIQVSNLLNNLNYAMYSRQGGTHRIDQAMDSTLEKLGILQITIIYNNQTTPAINIPAADEPFVIKRCFYAQILNHQGGANNIPLDIQELSISSTTTIESIAKECQNYFEQQEVVILKGLQNKTISLSETPKLSTHPEDSRNLDRSSGGCASRASAEDEQKWESSSSDSRSSSGPETSLDDALALPIRELQKVAKRPGFVANMSNNNRKVDAGCTNPCNIM